MAAGEAVGLGAGQGEAGGQGSARVTAGSGQRYRSFKTRIPEESCPAKAKQNKGNREQNPGFKVLLFK